MVSEVRGPRNVRILAAGEVIPEGMVAVLFDPTANHGPSGSGKSDIIAQSSAAFTPFPGLEGISWQFNVIRPKTKVVTYV